MSAGPAPSEALRENLVQAPLPASGGLLAIFGVPCFVEASPVSLPLSLRGVLSVSSHGFLLRVSPLLTRTLVMLDLRRTRLQWGLISTHIFMTSAKTLCPNKVTFKGTRVGTWTHPFGRCNSPTTIPEAMDPSEVVQSQGIKGGREGSGKPRGHLRESWAGKEEPRGRHGGSGEEEDDLMRMNEEKRVLQGGRRPSPGSAVPRLLSQGLSSVHGIWLQGGQDLSRSQGQTAGVRGAQVREVRK